MTIGNSGIDGNFLVYPGQAANTILANNTGSTAAPTALTVEQTQILLGNYARVAGSNATTSSASLVDITGLTLALSASAAYAFEAVLVTTTSADANGIQYAVQFSASGASVVAQITGAATSTTARNDRMTSLNSPSTAFMTTSTQNGGMLIKGILTTTTNAGNLTIQHAKVTGGTSTVLIGSYLKATRIA